MDIQHELFTTDKNEGWIEVIRKSEREERMNKDFYVN